MEVLQRTANRGSISTGYDIENSYKNENDNTERMYRAWGGITANTRTWTVSLWVKRTELGACYIWGAGVSGNDVVVVDFDSSDRLGFRSTKSAADDCVYRTNRVFRDISAWYHLVFAVDTTSGTAGNRLRIYVNGVEETSFATETNFDQNDLTLHNANGSYMEVGSVIGESPRFNGYIAEVNSITGTQYAPTAFGKFDDNSGIWIPILFAGSYAENSVFLEFKDSSSLGTDTSGNGQTFTLQNLSAADQATDTPTNNFCTLNPLWTFANTMGVSDGGTKVNNTVIAWGGAKGSIGVNSGKWYWEHGSFSGNDTMFGIQNQAGGGNTQAYLDPYTLAIQANSNVIQFTDPSNRTEAFTKTFSITDIWGVALDLDANTIAFYRNGSIVNSAFSIDGLIGNGEFFPFVTHYGSGLNSRVNFGGYTGISISTPASDENGYGTFEYAPPSGYYALCTKNLAEYG